MRWPMRSTDPVNHCGDLLDLEYSGGQWGPSKSSVGWWSGNPE